MYFLKRSFLFFEKKFCISLNLVNRKETVVVCAWFRQVFTGMAQHAPYFAGKDNIKQREKEKPKLFREKNTYFFVIVNQNVCLWQTVFLILCYTIQFCGMALLKEDQAVVKFVKDRWRLKALTKWALFL